MALLTIVLLILLNGVFAMSEMAVVASRRARLRERVRAGDRAAAIALELHNAPNVFLSTVQIGITLVGVLLGAVGERVLANDMAAVLARVPSLAAYSDARALGLVVIAITYVSLIVGELVPKRLALYHPEAIARVVARPMRLLSWLTYPAVRLLSVSVDLSLKLLRARPPTEPTITAGEIRSMIEEGTRAGVLLKAEQDLLTNVIRFADRSISLLMTPPTSTSARSPQAPTVGFRWRARAWRMCSGSSCRRTCSRASSPVSRSTFRPRCGPRCTCRTARRR